MNAQRTNIALTQFLTTDFPWYVNEVMVTLTPDFEAIKEIDETDSLTNRLENDEIVTLVDEKLILVKLLSINVEKEGEFFVAQCMLLEEFGYGYSKAEAVDDLKRTISELYWTLKGEQKRLGAHLNGIWNNLRTIIKEK
jgi:hypothetical protein